LQGVDRQLCTGRGTTPKATIVVLQRFPALTEDNAIGAIKEVLRAFHPARVAEIA